MTEDVKPPVEHRTPRPAGAHAGHDELLIARFASDDVTDTEAARARGLTRDCSNCAALFADIAAISTAVRTDLPAPIRPRDFRLSPEQARSLRGRPSFAAWLSGLLRPGGSMLQPLAGAAMSIGIALIVAGTVLPAPTVSRNEAQSGVVPGLAASAAPSQAAGGDSSTGPVPAAAASPASGDRNATMESAGAAGPVFASPAVPAPSQAPSASAVPGDTAQGTNAPPTTSPMVVSGGPTESAGGGIAKSESPSPTESPRFNAYDQATPSPVAAAAAPPGRDETPAPGAAGPASPLDQPVPPEDRRPLLITLGLLLGLSGAVLFGVRRVAHRA